MSGSGTVSGNRRVDSVELDRLYLPLTEGILLCRDAPALDSFEDRGLATPNRFRRLLE